MSSFDGSDAFASTRRDISILPFASAPDLILFLSASVVPDVCSNTAVSLNSSVACDCAHLSLRV